MRHLLRPGGAACTALLLSLYARAEPTGGDCHVGSRRIKALAAAGRITLALFPHAEHGLTEYEFNAAGDRVSPRYAAGYFAMMRDFIRNGRLPDAPAQAARVTGVGTAAAAAARKVSGHR